MALRWAWGCHICEYEECEYLMAFEWLLMQFLFRSVFEIEE